MHRHVRSLAATALVVVLAHRPTGPLAAQTPAERATIDAFRDTLGALTDPSMVQQLVTREKGARPATGDKELQRLRLGWALTRYGQLTDSAPPMIE
ncbi:MAG TPA: hypothetical protein VF454_02060, partial [Gemmatimonadales bacterium]